MARIFVIDDDVQLLEMIRLILERGGHTPTLLHEARPGLERVRLEKPDLLVVDVMMPGMSGYDLCRQIREMEGLSNLPILVLTSRTQEIDRQTALRSGATDFMSKPILPRTFTEKVNNILLNHPQKRIDPKNAFTVSLLGMRGGTGRTTLAVNLALALCRFHQQEVCLLELSPNGGQITSHLRQPATPSWADLSAKPSPLGWHGFQAMLQKHSSGLHLLSAPAIPQSPLSPSAELVVGWLALLKTQMNSIIIDLPAIFSPAVQIALEQSQMIIHLITPDVVSIKIAGVTQKLLTQGNVARVPKVFVMNQITPDTLLSELVVEKGLGSRLAFKIGYDTQQQRALTQGTPVVLMEGASPISVTAQRMAEAIAQYGGSEK